MEASNFVESVQVQAEPEKIAAKPEEMPASASSKVPNPNGDPEIKAEMEEIEGILTQKSEAKFGEEKVEIEKTKTVESEINPRPTGWKCFVL